MAGLVERVPILVTTVNTDHLVRLRERPDLLPMYLHADVLCADGAPVVWASRLLGQALPERVTGVDLMEDLCASLASRRGSVFLLGGTEAIVDRAGKSISARHPGIRVAGTHHGFFDLHDDTAVVRKVRRSGADVLFVGMGSPRQERWAAHWKRDLSVPITVCVGGSLEVLAGVRSRAPRWMQQSGMEWFHRFQQEPSRLWHRYFVEDPVFISIVVREWRQQHAAA